MTPQLIEEINIEISSMKMIVKDVAILLSEVDNQNPSNIHKSALGAFASQFYNGIENRLKRIHRANNLELPKGDDWHIKLIERFSTDSEFKLPIKLSKDLIEKLTNYRRFRHYFFMVTVII